MEQKLTEHIFKIRHIQDGPAQPFHNEKLEFGFPVTRWYAREMLKMNRSIEIYSKARDKAARTAQPPIEQQGE